MVPVYLMPLDSVPVGVTRDVAYVLTLGTSKLWTGIHSVMIGATLTAPTAAAVTIVSVRSSEKLVIAIKERVGKWLWLSW